MRGGSFPQPIETHHLRGRRYVKRFAMFLACLFVVAAVGCAPESTPAPSTPAPPAADPGTPADPAETPADPADPAAPAETPTE